jgi:hypothetical protein
VQCLVVDGHRQSNHRRGDGGERRLRPGPAIADARANLHPHR